MRIGIFTDTYPPYINGVSTSIVMLKRALERLGHEVFIVTVNNENMSYKYEEDDKVIRLPGIPIGIYDYRLTGIYPIRVINKIKNWKLDVIHSQTEFGVGTFARLIAKQMHIPIVHTYHTMYEDYLHYVAKGKLLKPSHVRLMTCSFCEKMSGVVAPSARVLETLTRYGVKEPITVIPTGVDLTRFKVVNENNVRKHYGIAENAPLLLTLSRLAFEKDIDRMVASFPAIKTKVPGVKLLIVGDGPAKESLQEQVKELGLTEDIIFTGEVDNTQVSEFYHAADLFVSTSISESQGLTYIEALAAGTKVVSSKSPYTAELLSDRAIGANFETLEEFVELVVEYLTKPAKYQDPKPLQQKLKEISADEFGEKILQFYERSKEHYLELNQTTYSKEHS